VKELEFLGLHKAGEVRGLCRINYCEERIVEWEATLQDERTQ